MQDALACAWLVLIMVVNPFGSKAKQEALHAEESASGVALNGLVQGL
jgi:hypothetical protein